jgi:hypothetical protein
MRAGTTNLAWADFAPAIDGGPAVEARIDAPPAANESPFDATPHWFAAWEPAYDAAQGPPVPVVFGSVARPDPGGFTLALLVAGAGGDPAGTLARRFAAPSVRWLGVAPHREEDAA